jgi:hypothetical protein
VVSEPGFYISRFVKAPLAGESGSRSPASVDVSKGPPSSLVQLSAANIRDDALVTHDPEQSFVSAISAKVEPPLSVRR